MNAVFQVQAIMSLVDHITGPLRAVKAGMAGAEGGALRLSARLGQVAKAMLPLAAAAGIVLAGLAGPINTSADFQASVSGLGAISQASAKDLGVMRQAALDLGAATSFSASQVVQGQTELAKKGFTTNEIVAAMPGLLDLAAATQADLGFASQVASGALKSFNMDASQTGMVADIIAAASTKSSTDIEGLSASLANAGSVAAAAGADFADLAALTGALANANINGAVAGTAIKIMFQRLQAPTGEAASTLASWECKPRTRPGTCCPYSTC